MLALFFALAITESQQAQHDRAENALYQRIQADRERISDVWRPNARLISDFKKLQACYAKFHLYKVPGCEAELTRVDGDLLNVEMVRPEHHD
jgi:hypothetical protein